MSPILEVKNLSKSYKSHFYSRSKKALHNISFDIAQGGMTGFLGINGSGKSTTIKCLLELIFPESGEILFFGKKLSPEIKRRISYLSEKPQLYDHLKGDEFLEFTLKLSNQFSLKEIQKKVDETLELVQLTDARSYKLREYSKGMYQRIGLAQAVSRNADFIILDEPMADLDPAGRHLVKTILKDIQTAKNATIFFSSHLLQDIEDLCKNIVILDKGNMKYSGATFDFLKKIKPSYEIHFEEAGRLANITVDQAELQNKIDELRSKKKSIVGIQNQNSLEDAFQKFIGGQL